MGHGRQRFLHSVSQLVERLDTSMQPTWTGYTCSKVNRSVERYLAVQWRWPLKYHVDPLGELCLIKDIKEINPEFKLLIEEFQVMISFEEFAHLSFI